MRRSALGLLACAWDPSLWTTKPWQSQAIRDSVPVPCNLQGAHRKIVSWHPSRLANGESPSDPPKALSNVCHGLQGSRRCAPRGFFVPTASSKWRPLVSNLGKVGATLDGSVLMGSNMGDDMSGTLGREKVEMSVHELAKTIPALAPCPMQRATRRSQRTRAWLRRGLSTRWVGSEVFVPRERRCGSPAVPGQLGGRGARWCKLWGPEV